MQFIYSTVVFTLVFVDIYIKVNIMISLKKVIYLGAKLKEKETQ